MRSHILQRIWCMALILFFAAAAGGCGRGKEQITELSVGFWPKDNNVHELKIYENWKNEFEKTHKNIKLTGSQYTYNANTFVAKAACGQLPDVFTVPYTEPEKIIKAGYAADITKYVKEYGFYSSINTDIEDICSYEGRVYGMPRSVYVLGLWCNTELFRQAGLTDEHGLPVYPHTFEELRTTAKTIKNKTGVNGFMMPVKDSTGGWHFTNMAWNYGTVFEKKDADGGSRAVFGTEETARALRLLRAMRFEDGSISGDENLGYADVLQNFALNKTGMVIGAFEESIVNMMINQYNMPKENFFICPMPEGPGGKTALMGGNVLMFSSNCTPEQICAGLEFLKTTGYFPKMDDTVRNGIEDQLRADTEDGNMIFPVTASVWKDPERIKEEEKLREKYVYADRKFYTDYINSALSNVRREPEYCSQELYTELSRLIRDVLASPDSDIEALLLQSEARFENNYLSLTSLS